jgi:uncharacterized protein (DUF849 family)
VGLEDAPFGHAVSNIDQVRAARKKIEASGRPVATSDDIRQRLAGTAPG